MMGCVKGICVSKTYEKKVRLKRHILRLSLAFLVLTLVLVTPFNAAKSKNVSESLNYKQVSAMEL